MDLHQVLRSRASIRAFEPRPIPADVLQRVLDAALASPSWANTQPYRLALATNAACDEIRRDLLAACEREVPNGDHLLSIGSPDGARVLADRYHHRLLPTPREVHRALRYVLLNARRHAAKARKALAHHVRLDPASSARWFDGWKRGAAKDDRTSAERAPVARARTWLLTSGWRRHGLLDPADVPG